MDQNPVNPTTARPYIRKPGPPELRIRVLNVDYAEKQIRTVVKGQIERLMRESGKGALDKELISLLQTCHKLLADFRREDKEYAAKVPKEQLVSKP